MVTKWAWLIHVVLVGQTFLYCILNLNLVFLLASSFLIEMSEEEKARDESSVSGVSFKLQKSSRGNKKMIGNLIDDSTVDENRKKDYLLSVEDNQLHR